MDSDQMFQGLTAIMSLHLSEQNRLKKLALKVQLCETVSANTPIEEWTPDSIAE